MKGIIAKKIGMNQVFDASGNVIPVTLLYVEPCVVIEKKTQEKHGYSALKLGVEKQKEHRINKPLMGMFKKAGIEPVRIIKEIRFEEKDIEGINVGDKIDLSILDEAKNLDVQGLSKGRGFAGWMKRYGFKGSPGSHGAHEVHRRPGSIGSNTWPGRVYKGKRMAGHYGNKTITVMNLKIVKIDIENNLLVVKGAVPGAMNGILVVKQV